MNRAPRAEQRTAHRSRFYSSGHHGPLAIIVSHHFRLRLAAAFVLAVLAGWRAPVAAAQEVSGPPVPVPGLQQNSISVLEARGDSLFIGPCLSLTTDGGASFQQIAAGQVCGEATSRLLSLDGEGDVLVAGLGRSAAGDVSAAAGFLVSRDGGQSFQQRLPQLDTGTEDTVRYGVNLLPALPVVVPEESAPFAVDYVDSTGALWVAGRASGLRRSTDGGQSFERMVLPPDSLDAIVPFQPYRFPLRPRRGRGPGFLNHIVNSVLVDETGTVWAGTSAAVNRSRPADVFVFERPGGTQFRERAWRRFGFDNTAASDSLGAGLTGNFVTRISEQSLAEQRNPVWMATGPTDQAGERFGVTITRDGGQTFQQTLVGEQVSDFAFRGDTVYAASERGLFISSGGVENRTDTSYTWRLVQDFPGADLPESAVANTLRVLSVATTTGALWAGTEDGLLKSTDGGATWQVFRTRMPTDPAEPTEAVPRAETYAYPNPFSPVAAPSGVVRIVVETAEGEGNGAATVRLYDFAMRFVRQLSGACDAGGRCEVAWDGTGAGGARVANGVYFYEIEVAGSETARGKIMVLE